MLSHLAGIGVVYDCCGKPISELGLQEAVGQSIKRMEDVFEVNGVTEVITLCPNCYVFLKEHLSIRIVSVYEKLDEFGWQRKIPGGEKLFLPCPDREEQEFLKHIQSFCDKPLDPISGIQCCGLGGCAGVQEPELATRVASEARLARPVYTYCASCAGQLKRNGSQQVYHVLAKLLGTGEEADTQKSVWNRIKTRWS
jgi:Fe-S oxidoreductase